MKRIPNLLQMSTRAKLSLVLSLILVLAFLAINLSNYYTSRASLRRILTEDALPGISNDIYHEIQKDLIVPIQAASLMANDTFLRDWVLEGEEEVSRIVKYLWEIKERYGFFSTFLISSQSLKYFHFKGIHKIISPDDAHDVWYYDFIRSGADYVLDVDADEATNGTLTIFINHRVNDYQGRLIGVTGVGLNLSEVGRSFNAYRDRYHKNVYLVNKQGVIQVHYDQSIIEKKNIRNAPGIGEIAPDILTNTTRPTIGTYESEDRQIVLISRYVPEFDWFLIVEHEENQGLQEIRSNLYFSLVIGLVVTILVIFINVLLVNHYQGRLEKMASTDELTGLPNRRAFIHQARRDMAQASRSGNPISLLMIDIDHFKSINDNWGHEFGDWVLQETTQVIDQALRKSDLAGRMGGEEFAVILPQTGLEAALDVAERLRRLVEANDLSKKGQTCRVTISLGVAAGLESEKDLKILMRQADHALYQAKKQGRNRVCKAADAPDGDVSFSN